MKPGSATRRLSAQLLRALHAEWRKLSPNLSIEPAEGEMPAQAERRVRLQWSNQQFKGRKQEIESWNELTANQAKFLLKKMRAASGNTPLNDYVPEAAIELWAGDWDQFLAVRLGERFGVHRISELEPHQKAAMFEEICSRIARNDARTIEEVKRAIMAKCRRGGSRTAQGAARRLTGAPTPEGR
jgi:hypothetical protein